MGRSLMSAFGNHGDSLDALGNGDGRKLPARTSDAKQHFEIQVFSDTNINKSCKHRNGHNYPYECFLNPRINKPFTMNQEFLVCNELRRSNENFPLSRVAFLASKTDPQPHTSVHT